ncbi:Hypothetical predicted protein [Lecanosticta acicola]|uniref:Retrotransposon gag domain-containing protein n=1 Tax=Lecanosticta acicola TaxID=111012 RepID=A0AAI9E6W2_9PEZI|nr:Hypothetical predicted protein [Lecanosticta acicola]
MASQPQPEQQPAEGSVATLPTPETVPESTEQATLRILKRILALQEKMLIQNRARPPAPGSPGNPLFDGLNATAHVERFENFLIDYDLEEDSEEKKTRRFLGTLSEARQLTARGLEGAPDKSNPEATSWERLKRAFLKKYRDYDERQVRATRAWLENLCQATRTRESDLEGYVCDFVASLKDIGPSWISNTERVRLLLRGLPEEICLEVYIQCELDFVEGMTTEDFRRVLDCVRNEVDSRVDAREWLS